MSKYHLLAIFIFLFALFLYFSLKEEEVTLEEELNLQEEITVENNLQEEITVENKDSAKEKLKLKGFNFSEAAFLERIRENDIYSTRLFLIAGMNPDAIVSDKSAISTAIFYGYTEIVRALINAGANVNIRDSSRSTPLILASEQGHTNIAKELIKAGANVNSKGRPYTTALLRALKYGHTEIAMELISAGADVNSKDLSDFTALMYASKNTSNFEIANELIKAGADVNAKTSDGYTPLMFASDLGIVRALIKAGADVNAKTSDGYTPLMFASDLGIVRALINAGANVNAKNRTGYNALSTTYSKAINSGNFAVVFELIKAGIDVDVIYQSDSSFSIIALASKQGHTAIVRALIKAGADVNITGRSGRTALELAKRNGHTDIVAIIKENATFTEMVYSKLTLIEQDDRIHEVMTRAWSIKSEALHCKPIHPYNLYTYVIVKVKSGSVIYNVEKAVKAALEKPDNPNYTHIIPGAKDRTDDGEFDDGLHAGLEYFCLRLTSCVECDVQFTIRQTSPLGINYAPFEWDNIGTYNLELEERISYKPAFKFGTYNYLMLFKYVKPTNDKGIHYIVKFSDEMTSGLNNSSREAYTIMITVVEILEEFISKHPEKIDSISIEDPLDDLDGFKGYAGRFQEFINIKASRFSNYGYKVENLGRGVKLVLENNKNTNIEITK